MLIFGYVICGIAISAGIPVFSSVFYLLFLTLASLCPRKIRRKKNFSAKIAILISAHNEEKNIEKSVAKLITQLNYPSDLYEVIVIANNCTDSTSYIASFSGARVLERTNEWKITKWHALEWAINKLKKDEFDIFLILNAGSFLEPDTLQYLDAEFREGHIAMQLMLQPEKRKYSWKNAMKAAFDSPVDCLEPKGRDRIGFSAPLIGNGSCITANIIKQIPLDTSGNDGSDEYYFKLIAAGEKIRFIAKNKAKTIVSGNIEQKQINNIHLKKFLKKLMKESLKGNCTALESLFYTFIPSIKLIFTSLIVLMFTGGMLCLAADLPGAEILLKYGIVIFILAAFSIIILHLYIFIAMIEKKVSLKIWIAALLWPIISITAFLLGNSEEN